MNSQKPLNTGTVRGGLLDEHLSQFWVETANNMGAMCFQFETGGMKVVFRQGMTMTEWADKFEEAAERMRRYQAAGWPNVMAPGN